MSSNRALIHFPNLTEFRGILAVIVMLSHVDQFHYLFGFESIGLHQTGVAGDAVTSFFVLSGFLITYLLAQEKKQSGTIHIKHFYMRRIIRIWPVYYFSIFISLLLISFDVIQAPNKLWQTIALFALFIPNISTVLGITIRSLTPLWSVGVEEQFYAIWPWLVKKFSNTSLILVGLIVLYILLKSGIWYYNKSGALFAIVNQTRIDCMAVGGIFAMLYFQKKHLDFLYHPAIQLIGISILVITYAFNISLVATLEIEIKSICIGLFIINLATNPKSLIQLSNPVLQFFGKISYGVYCYHMSTFFLLVFISQYLGLNSLIDNMVVTSLITLTMTTLLAYLSYKYVEKPILALKSRFS